MLIDRNLLFLFEKSGCRTHKEFASKLCLERSGVTKLLNGAPASRRQLSAIAQYAGVEIEDLHIDHDQFVELYSSRMIKSDFMVHNLRTIGVNLKKCRELFHRYEGQYIVYTSSFSDDRIIASLLNISRVTKHGIEFDMINPYQEESGKYSAYKYQGYLMPLEEFLYFVGEQEDQSYEILTMLFEASGAPKVKILKGLWTGVGVKNGKKIIASVNALAVKQDRPISDWRSELDKQVGYLKISALSELIQRNIDTGIVSVNIGSW